MRWRAAAMLGLELAGLKVEGEDELGSGPGWSKQSTVSLAMILKVLCLPDIYIFMKIKYLNSKFISFDELLLLELILHDNLFN
ncbi:hypothetical protein BY996DRAFT_6701706 [Phakopsora pachyrhizi]|nr:hypothetical protein BY996DRAFT_6701706 [Phakopsora pachyrhizi]